MATKAANTKAAVQKMVAEAEPAVDAVLDRRSRMLRQRAKTLATISADSATASVATAEVAAQPTSHMVLAASAKSATRGWLVAEGDSWFDYPGWDVLDWLEQSGYDVESVASAGDRAEMMAFGNGQLMKLSKAFDKVIARGHVPKAILLSAGGNDIAGAEFGFLLNHAGSPKEGLNATIVRGVIDERLQDAYLHLIAHVTALCRKQLGRDVTILLHGYGHVVPDGDGVLGGWGPLPGPWLRPGFIEKGFNDLPANTATMAILMDRFNAMVSRVAKQFPHVEYVDLRDVLPATKKLWANELHPKESGFKLVAERFLKFL